MTPKSGSSLKVHYELRPSKQVERRMVIDALKKLSSVGFEIEEYTYIGMSSLYFVDFVLFHKFLGIESMTCAEKDLSVIKRVEYNKPYNFIAIDPSPVANVLSTISLDKKYFVWLDFDDLIDKEMLDSIWLAASKLSSGSLLLMTVDIEPRNDISKPAEWEKYLREFADPYLGLAEGNDFAESNLPKLHMDIIDRTIKNALTVRPLKMIPIFSFTNADGHTMLSIGGMIGGAREQRLIGASRLTTTTYYRGSFNKKPYRIYVPKVTRKERLYLDSAMPCPKNWTPTIFDMSTEDILAYSEIYRFFPAYAELLL